MGDDGLPGGYGPGVDPATEPISGLPSLSGSPPTAAAVSSSPPNPPPPNPSLPNLFPPNPPPVVPPSPEFLPAPPTRRSRRWVVPVTVAAFALVALVYVLDLVLSGGHMPRGVTVAGVDVGGRSRADAEAQLRTALLERSTRPIDVRAGDVTAQIVPKGAGLDIDWPATLDRVGAQSWNPITRATSWFRRTEVGFVPSVDDAALTAALREVTTQVDRQPVEGNIVFDGARPVAVAPVPGQELDLAAARDRLARHWVDGTPVDLPVRTTAVQVNAAAVERAMQTVAEPAVQSDVVFTGKQGRRAVLSPTDVPRVLSFAAVGDQLEPRYDKNAATALLAPQLAPSEVAPKDATVDVSGGVPRVVPAVVGDRVEWATTLDALPGLLAAPVVRTAAATYKPVPPKIGTEQAQGLGIREVIGQFTTSGFAAASGVNIRAVAAQVNGALVLPGDTFSLNGYTGPRGAAQGYVESGIIDHGRPAKAIGGGVSQFATTLYNAAYFAGLEDVTHTEHSYYISRYPEAREATVFEGAIDLQFRNNTQHGIVIQAAASDSDVTVRIWGTKTVDVESITGNRYAETEPTSLTLPKGDDCIPSAGAPGFTTSNTRVITDHATGGEVYRHTRTVKYDPVPIVKCV
ncbi:VanW family protein [Skermania piniformis]|uniref:VanW family protein n=1 Tax=Skermania pinensis TaxID=39122 RepID=A0ABX8S7G9_9ACTN|nr:VanW family protein [Skermania piniformis]